MTTTSTKLNSMVLGDRTNNILNQNYQTQQYEEAVHNLGGKHVNVPVARAGVKMSILKESNGTAQKRFVNNESRRSALGALNNDYNTNSNAFECDEKIACASIHAIEYFVLQFEREKTWFKLGKPSPGIYIFDTLGT
jgi:hypothetical protein